MTYASPPSGRPLLLGQRHMVIAGHPLATMAGLRVLEAGGNAVDAGVAAGFALNVLQPDMANLGGVAPIMLYLAEAGRVTTFSGVGRWPRAATRERLAAAGGGRIPAGPARWVVPAAVDAWLTALARYGSMSAGDVLAPAIELAERGFPLHYFLQANLGKIVGLPGLDYNRTMFLRDGGVPPLGTPMRQAELADTLRHLVAAERRSAGNRAACIQAARDAFYFGEIAERVGAFAQQAGSFLTAGDLNAFTVGEDPPVSVDYRGHTVFACGPWSQGPALLQMLNLLEAYPVAALGPVDRTHIAIECVKLGLRDRNRHYGDPEMVDVPLRRLLSKEYAATRRHALRRDTIIRHEPVIAGARSPDTTYVCAADAAGNLFSATPSDSTMLMSPMVPGLGFGISDRGLQASLDPDDPNVVAPGKRPRLTPNPGIVLGADFSMPYGTPGGEVQTQAMLQFLIHHLDLGMDPQQAVEAPRWACMAVPATEDPHPAEADRVCLERRADTALFEGLRHRGHDVETWPDLAALAGSVCAIRREHRTGVLAGGADPRRMAYGIGW